MQNQSPSKLIKRFFAEWRGKGTKAEAMQYGLPSFGEICVLASQKNYMALYVCEADLVTADLPQLAKVSCGKGCIRFKRIGELNLSAIEDLLREILKRREQGIGPSCR